MNRAAIAQKTHCARKEALKNCGNKEIINKVTLEQCGQIGSAKKSSTLCF